MNYRPTRAVDPVAEVGVAAAAAVVAGSQIGSSQSPLFADRSR